MEKKHTGMVMFLVVLGFLAQTVMMGGCKKPEPEEKKPEAVTEKNKPGVQTQAGSTAGRPERMARVEIKPPENLLHCGNDPKVHGAVEDPKRPGEYSCPASLEDSPVCAYFYGPRNPGRLRNLQYKNSCNLCVMYYKKDEKWEGPVGTHVLLGYEQGECTQGVYRIKEHMKRGRFREGGRRGPLPGSTAP